MMSDKLKNIIKKHKKWINGQKGGELADLGAANLRGVDLKGVDLRCANLRGADLQYADLREANLLKANLQKADLSGANLCGVDLYCANLQDACLYGVDLSGSDLWRANLQDADLRGAKNVPFIPMVCPDSGSFTAWKKANGHIVKLLIPEDARRSSATGRKCRCDKAVVLAIETVSGESTELNEIASNYDDEFIYKVGETVTEPKFCEDRFDECAAGIHFFINRQEAEEWVE